MICSSRGCGWSSLSFSLHRGGKSCSGQTQTLLLGHSEHMFVRAYMETDHRKGVVLDKCVFSVTQDAVAIYKETRNGLIGLDYSTKFSPWWVILPFCEQGLIFHVSKFYGDIWRYDSAGWHWVAFHPGIFIIRTSNMRMSEQPIRAHIGECGE